MRGILYSVGLIIFYALHVTKEKAMQKLSRWPRKSRGEDEIKQRNGAKNADIPFITNLLKPEEQKSSFLLSLQITQWLLSLPSWHSNYTSLRNAGISGHAWSSHFFLIFFWNDRLISGDDRRRKSSSKQCALMHMLWMYMYTVCACVWEEQPSDICCCRERQKQEKALQCNNCKSWWSSRTFMKDPGAKKHP